MRKVFSIAAGAALSMAVALPHAEAAARAYWDQATGTWMKVDENNRVLSGGGSKRNYNPIPRKIVDYDGPFRPNTIVVNTKERRLYYVMAGGKAWKYGIGVGREGFTWSGADNISRKAEWPGWTPPPEMIKREKAKGRILPAFMEGGPNNPLGARALYIGGTLYRIHGSNEPWSIGQAVSSGCIRLTNDDVTDLYEKVRVGTRVVVLSGDESPTRLAALANPPPPPKKDPVVVDARVKDDAIAAAPEDVTGSVEPQEEIADASLDVAPMVEVVADPNPAAEAAEPVAVEPAPVRARPRIGH